MATVVLQVVGAAIGGAIGGPVGATIGRAVGAAAGYAIDHKLFSKDQVIKGGRLDQSRFLGSSEGTVIPKVYGRVKIGGQLIWATRFEERRNRKKQGGKGGPSVTTESYRYFGNFAVGICEGEISRIGRIWADGREIDQTRLNIRTYTGRNDQQPDPMIEALQGQGRTPAFRGTAYAAFEDFPLANYGNRIPQITFEVIRSISRLDREIRAITLIPGATEFGYSPTNQRSSIKGRTISENRHVKTARSDWEASIDELQAICPNLERVSLVVTWFGTDLRAEYCKVEPRCVHDDAERTPWHVSGVDRSSANPVSLSGGSPAYGGTPSDQSVLDAIADLKSRGLKVALYPFLMMDIPTGNSLPDPYGEAEQAAYPWRGRVTCQPAIGMPGTADRSATAASQVSHFVGLAAPANITVASGLPVYAGPPEFSYRRMILHYARLCNLAGGVERFFIGSEMRSLTTVRDGNDGFPFVEALVDLAGDVRQILGPNAQISYAADWSEYFGYHPQDGSGDAFFHLDPLWASPDIAAVSIDNYMPVSDWMEAGDPGQPEAPSRFALSYLKSNIDRGEGLDWYYATAQDRLHGNRTPITDGLGEPWIWSYKALSHWWLNPHHERRNGVRLAQPTAWVPGSKPVWFSEIGCPAVDRGANRPNVFMDEKSAESALPYHSKGGRDDLMQLRYLQALLEFWSEAGTAQNPKSPLYDGRMIEPENIYPWAWDARPFPAFPNLRKVWSDGENWYRGHWFNGRAGTCPIDDLIAQIVADHGFAAPRTMADGHVEGYIIAGETSPRQALEPLLAAFNLTVSQDDEALIFTGKDYSQVLSISEPDLVQEDDNPRLVRISEGEGELARQITISHGELDNNFEVTTSTSRRLETASQRQQTVELPAVLPRQAAKSLMNARLRDLWTARQTVRFSLSQRHLRLEAGDTISLPQDETYRVLSVTTGIQREVEGVKVRRFDEAGPWYGSQTVSAEEFDRAGPPLVMAMNLPLNQNSMDPEAVLHFAATISPWTVPLAIFSSATQSGFEQVGVIPDPALVFELRQPLIPGPVGRWDHSNTLLVELLSDHGEFASSDELSVLAGANALAVETASGSFELIQFKQAELISPGFWKLTGLLRAQLGTEPEMSHGAPTGSLGVLLDDALVPVQLPRQTAELVRNWRIGPADQDLASDDYSALTASSTQISRRPMPAVHLRARRVENRHELRWIRQTRIGGDDWSGEDVPLDFHLERYRLRVSDAVGSERNRWESTSSFFQYADTQRLADLGSLTTTFRIHVSQLDERGIGGPERTIEINP